LILFIPPYRKNGEFQQGNFVNILLINYLAGGKRMNMRTKSLYPFGGEYYEAHIFGYATKGIPGVEIVGLGKHSRAIKEKFIYLSRQKQLKFPLRRYVLCVEGELEGKKFKEEEFRYLELPLLMMLWSLTGHLLFERLDDCFLSGKVSVEGEVYTLKQNQKMLDRLELLFNGEEERIKIVAPQRENFDDFLHIHLEELWESIGEQERRKTD